MSLLIAAKIWWKDHAVKATTSYWGGAATSFDRSDVAQFSWSTMMTTLTRKLSHRALHSSVRSSTHKAIPPVWQVLYCLRRFWFIDNIAIWQDLGLDISSIGGCVWKSSRVWLGVNICTHSSLPKERKIVQIPHAPHRRNGIEIKILFFTSC